MLYKDRSGAIWIGNYSDGLERLDPALGTFTHYRHQPGVSTSLGSNDVHFVYQDNSGTIWVKNSAGLDRLDPSKGSFVHYRHDPRDPAILNEDGGVFEDRQGNFWVTTPQGLNKVDRTIGRSTPILLDPKNPRDLGSGTLWSAGLYLSALDTKTQKVTRYSYLSEKPGNESAAVVLCLHEDADGSLWLGTIEDGLLKLDADRKQFSRYAIGQTTRIFEDAEEVMWIGTRTSGVLRLLRKSPAFVTYEHKVSQPHDLVKNEIQSVGTDSRGNLWIGTTKGLEMLERSTGRITLYQHDSKNPSSLSKASVFAIAEDRSGRMTAWNRWRRNGTRWTAGNAWRHIQVFPPEITFSGSRDPTTISSGTRKA
jgi:ligand-binding sensor domain-containing protein